MTKEEYIESEMKKLSESFVIDYMDSFEIENLLGLQYQLNKLDDSEIATKLSIVRTISFILHKLKLKPKLNETDIIAVIDAGRDQTIVTGINHNDGTIQYRRKVKGNLKEQADLLYKIFISTDTKKVIFDKKGIGIGIYDAFKKGRFEISFLEDGTLIR